MIDKAKVCFSQQENLSTEHFVELIGERVEDCAAWERMMRKTKEQMLKTLEELQDVNYGRRNK